MRVTTFIAVFFCAGVVLWCLYAVGPTYYMKAKRWLQRRITRKADTAIVLTFDDGPSPHYTADLLDVLRSHNVRATFFVVGVFAQDNPELIRRMHREGHAIGIHSFAHENGLTMSPAKSMADIECTKSALHELGIAVRWYRPPWGHFNIAMLLRARHLGLRPFLWDVMAQDWLANTSVEMIEQKLHRRTTPGSIVCLHDGRGRNRAPRRTITALRNIIPAWKREGLLFETADEYGAR